MSDGKTYVDITELVNWHGRLTGVPRVMDELSSRLKTEIDCFVVWNERRNRFEEVDYIQTHDYQDSEEGQTDNPTIKARLKRTITWGIRKSALASKLTEIALSSLRGIYGLRVYVIPGRKPAVVRTGDILVILADWHSSDKRFIPQLLALHERGVAIIQFSYDLLPLVTPQYSGHATKTFERYVSHVYPLCKLIIAISEHTKADITTWLTDKGKKVPQIEVVRLGDDFRKMRPARPINKIFNAKLEQHGTYLLCVGTIEARKNHMLLYYTYKLAAQRGVDLPCLVIVGRRGWLSDAVYEALTKDPEVASKFVHLKNASDGELAWLYAHSRFTVYPSFYEGWGLPVAESLARGVPCLSSNTSSIPEIAGDQGHYFNPYSPEDCLANIMKLLTDVGHEDALKDAAQYRRTSWDDTFNQVKKILEKTNE